VNHNGMAYTVELWTPDGASIERTFISTDSINTAHAVYEAAVETHPRRRITLRNRSMIVRHSGRGAANGT